MSLPPHHDSTAEPDGEQLGGGSACIQPLPGRDRGDPVAEPGISDIAAANQQPDAAPAGTVVDVEGAGQLHVVTPDGRSLTASLLGADKIDDLAVVSVPAFDLTVATFGDSAKLQVGQTVVAMGGPLGNVGSVTQGVISARHRTIPASNKGSGATESLEDALQTDAPDQPGQSGGPLADSSGRVVGVNVAVEQNGAGNIGYTIPGNLARRVAEAIIAGRPVGHPFIGVAYQTSVQAIEAGHGFDGPGV